MKKENIPNALTFYSYCFYSYFYSHINVLAKAMLGMW